MVRNGLCLNFLKLIEPKLNAVNYSCSTGNYHSSSIAEGLFISGTFRGEGRRVFQFEN